MAIIKGRIKKRNLGNTPKKKEKAKAKIQREVGRAFREKLLKRAKLFGKKTKLEQLMRQYKKLQKTWKGKAEFPEITYLSLENSNFKLTRKNIEGLMSQLSGTIIKMKGASEYPKELLISMLEGCLMTAYKNEIDASITDRMQMLLNDKAFENACDDPSKSTSIYDLLVLLYDVIGAGDEMEASSIIDQLYDIR